MRGMLASLYVLFLACLFASAARYQWEDDGYNYLREDAPDAQATEPPLWYNKHVDMSTPPLNRSIGSGIINLLVGRVAILGCERCAGAISCCNNGTYCCTTDGTSCTTATWCCPRDTTPCPGAPNVCITAEETCCGTGACTVGSSTCCGSACCNQGFTCTDGVCINPATLTTSTSTTPTTSTSTTTTSTSTTTTSTSTTTTSTSDPPPVSASNPPPTNSSDTPPVSPPNPPPVNSSDTPPVSSSNPPPVNSSDTFTVSLPNPPPINSSDTLPASSSDAPPDPSSDPPSDPPPDPSSDLPPDTSSDSLPTSLPDPPPTDTPLSPQSTEAVIDETQGTTATSIPAQSNTVAAAVTSSSLSPTTITSNGVTLTVTPTPSAATNTLTTQNAQQDSSDSVALVQPWDPRIVYSPPNAWVSTSSSSGTGSSSSSGVGSCHNGTMVCDDIAATIQFPFEGKEIAVLIVDGSKGGSYTVQIDGSLASTLSSYKNTGTQGDQCLVSQPFTSAEYPEGSHNITITIKGIPAGSSDSQIEFGGFIYRGQHATGTTTGSKSNIPAIVGGTVGGVVGGIAILAIVIVIIVRRRRRNDRLDNASAINQAPPVAPTHATPTPYTPVPTAEYHDPYASAGLGPQYYPSAAAASSSMQEQGQQPVWASTNQGPFGTGSFAAGGAGPSYQYGYAQ